MNIYESAEDYLEAILILRERQGAVRSIDVVHQLELTKPSVSVAMKRFRENGYIEMDSEGFISPSTFPSFKAFFFRTTHGDVEI